MIPVRYECGECGKDLGVFWQGVGDDNEPRPICPEHGDEFLYSSSEANTVAFGWPTTINREGGIKP